uniref:UBIQUITIN_CONJUGAT_2 domain-containing protein n=1 Tax=Glossina brevipalpis TaxID=37001 RepID=A0A1A9WSA4_9MUSC
MDTASIFKESKRADSNVISNENESEKCSQQTNQIANRESKGHQLGAISKKISNVQAQSTTSTNSSVGTQYICDDEVFRLGKNENELEKCSQQINQTVNRELKGHQLGAISKKISNVQGQSTTSTNSSVGTKYICDDEVFRLGKNGRVKFGLVLETSELYSDEDDEEFEKPLVNEELRVIWYPKGKKVIVKDNSVGLVARNLMPGEIVRRTFPGKFTHSGYCSNVHKWADVRVLGTKYVIKNIDAERLRLISPWQNDNLVCLGSWMGIIEDVEERAILRTSSGSRVEMNPDDFRAFKDIHSPFLQCADVFYPGNVIFGSLPPLQYIKILTPDIPLHTHKKGKSIPHKFIVENVYTDTVWVRWQCKVFPEEPDLEQIAILSTTTSVSGESLKRLKILNSFEPCMLQINDRNYLTYSSDDTIMKKSEWHKKQSEKFKAIVIQQRNEGCANDTIRSKSLTKSGCIAPQGVSNHHHHYEKSKKKVIRYLDKLKKLSFKCKERAHKNKGKMNRDQDESENNEWILKMENISTDKNSCSDALDQKSKIIKENLEKVVINANCKYNCSVKREIFNEEILCESMPRKYSDEKEEEGHTCSDQYLNDSNTSKPMPTCSSSSSPNSLKCYSSQLFKKKSRQYFRKPLLHKNVTKSKPKVGDELVVELLLVYSTATVVWQDGTTEYDIPSTELYPINNAFPTNEFFPGDFVISGKEEGNLSLRDYGVIQKVDHIGRIADVKWFTIYASPDDPNPTYKGDSVVSAYDLRNHPNFQYRPGTMVIRVANFISEEAKRTTGKIIDKCSDGRVKVHWDDGFLGTCWPQELFAVDKCDFAADVCAQCVQHSWETESVISECSGGDNNYVKVASTESQILTYIEQVRIRVCRLEEIFNINSCLRNSEIMKKLLKVYRGCRCMDRLLKTNFFHKDDFKTFVERARKEENYTFKQHNAAQHNAAMAMNNAHKSQSKQALESSVSKEFSPHIFFDISSTQMKTFSHTSSDATPVDVSLPSRRRCSPSLTQLKTKKVEDIPSQESKECGVENKKNEAKTVTLSIAENNVVINKEETSLSKSNQSNAEKNELLNSSVKVYEKTTLSATATDSSSRTSFCYFLNNELENAWPISSTHITNAETKYFLVKIIEDLQSACSSASEINEDEAPDLACVHLCSLLKEQFVQFIELIKEKKFKYDYSTISNVFSNIVIEIEDLTNAAIGQIEQLEGKKDFGMHLLPVEKATQTSNSPKLPRNSKVAYIPSETTVTTCKAPSECFQILPAAPKSHRYYSTIFPPTNTQQYYKAIQREHRMLSSLPTGVWVRGFEDRMDLLCVMIEGPEKTPYEDGVFLFDFQMGSDYPKSPPECHYISYCKDRLSPNLYEGGKVCVSLLGTWLGKDTETWGPNSTTWQVILSIQALILVDEPYFNEPGYEKQKGTSYGVEKSRVYNEMVIIKLVQSATKQLQNPPDIFSEEIFNHFKKRGSKMYERLKRWVKYSLKSSNESTEYVLESSFNVNGSDRINLPEFALLPASRGFCLTLNALLENFKQKLNSLNNNNTNNT